VRALPAVVDNDVEIMGTTLRNTGEPAVRPVDNSDQAAAGGRSALLAGTQVSGLGPSVMSSVSCMAHHGEMDCCPAATAAQN
jgi:hypothetical protein